MNVEKDNDILSTNPAGFEAQTPNVLTITNNGEYTTSITNISESNYKNNINYYTTG